MLRQMDNRPSKKERKHQLREEAILDATLTLLTSKGYTALTIEDILDEVGISKPTFYLHFKSKEELAVHVAIRGIRQAREKIASLDSAMSAADQLREFIHWLVFKKFEGGRICLYDFLANILLHAGKGTPLGIQERGLCFDLQELVARAQAQGSVRNDVSPLLVARGMMGIFRDWGLGELLEEGLVTVAEIEQMALCILFREGETAVG